MKAEGPEYEALEQALLAHGWHRIERDDRLLDVFLTERREKGVELWERIQDTETHLLRVRLPYDQKKLQLYALITSQLERMLQANMTAQLQDFELLADDEGVKRFLQL